MKKLLSLIGITSRHTFWELIKQFFKFGIVGASNTLISLGVYYILLYVGINYILANTAAFVAGSCNAYFWNSKFVFKEHSKRDAKAFVKSFVSYGSTFVLGTCMLYVFVDWLHISEWLAPLLNMCITIPLNFLLNKFWAFK